MLIEKIPFGARPALILRKFTTKNDFFVTSNNIFIFRMTSNIFTTISIRMRTTVTFHLVQSKISKKPLVFPVVHNKSKNLITRRTYYQ